MSSAQWNVAGLLPGIIGPLSGGVNNQYRQLRLTKDGSQAASDAHGRYVESTYQGNVFSLSVSAAAAITAYVGAAAGTPQIAIWNPAGSGKNAFILQASFGQAVAASAAGTVLWGIYYGPTAAITQATLTNPVNQLTLTTGSALKGYTNAALTSSTALTNAFFLGNYYWATAAAAFGSAISAFDVGGSICVPPGSMAALGGSSALTSATWVGQLIWEELPI
jgi:hypothetical protein